MLDSGSEMRLQIPAEQSHIEWEADVNPPDIRLAFRLFRGIPVPTGIALWSIALSLGATALVFTAINSVLIDPLP